MMVLGEFYTFSERTPHAQKAQKAQKATFFILNVFMHTKSTKSTRRQTSGFFFLDVFMGTKMLSFYFFFSLMCVLCFFVRFVFCYFSLNLEEKKNSNCVRIYFSNFAKVCNLQNTQYSKTILVYR